VLVPYHFRTYKRAFVELQALPAWSQPGSNR
jgi:hypothetical protein